MYKKLMILITWSIILTAKSSEDYLRGRLQTNDKRYSTFKQVLDLMEQRSVKVILETGTARCGASNFAGDGGSTIIWGNWANDHKAQVYSVDIDSYALSCASQATKAYNSNIRFVQQDSITFLRDFKGTIDLLYLDSFDFDLQNPTPSQEHHLKEIIAVYPHLHQNTIIMIDDCKLPHGGKGKLVIAYLLERGWKIIANQYQVILVQQ